MGCPVPQDLSGPLAPVKVTFSRVTGPLEVGPTLGVVGCTVTVEGTRLRRFSTRQRPGSRVQGTDTVTQERKVVRPTQV